MTKWHTTQAEKQLIFFELFSSICVAMHANIIRFRYLRLFYVGSGALHGDAPLGAAFTPDALSYALHCVMDNAVGCYAYGNMFWCL